MKLSGVAVACVLSALLWVLLPPWVPIVTGGTALIVGFTTRFPASQWMRGFGLTLCLFGIRFLPMPWQISQHVETDSSAQISFVVMGDPITLPERSGESLSRLPVHLRSVTANGESRTLRDRCSLMLQPEEQSPSFSIGSSWNATGRLVQRDDPHVGLQRSHWRFIGDTGTFIQTPSNGPAVSRLVFGLRDHLHVHLEKALSDSPEERAVLQALLLGNRGELPGTETERFARTGLIHIFAVSGLHIGMLTVLCWWVLRLLGVSQRNRIWWTLPVLILFVWFSGYRASSLRALIMIACTLAAPFWYRRLHLQNALYLSCCVILVLSPGQILDIGFQYSFALALGLMAFVQQDVTSLLERIAPDPWAPSLRFRTWRHRILWPFLLGSLLVSGWSILLSAPLTAYHFNLFSPVGILGNLLAVPMVFLLLLSGIPCFVLSMIPLPGVDALLYIPAFFARGLMNWSMWMDAIPHGWMWILQPALWMVVVIYALLTFSWLLPEWKRPCLLGILSVWMIYGAQRWVTYSESELIMLPADRGQAFYVRKGGHPGILIDTGSEWSASRMSRLLKEQGVNRIEAVFLSHPDRFHTGGWSVIQDRFHPGRTVVFSGDQATYHTRLGPHSFQTVTQGDTLTLAGWRIDVLHPSAADQDGRADDRSLVLRILDGHEALLFMGGAGATVEEALLSENEQIPVRMVSAGHPRSGSMMTQEFLDRVRPEWVLFSGEAFGGISLERRQAEQRIHAAGINVVRSAEREPVRMKLGSFER